MGFDILGKVRGVGEEVERVMKLSRGLQIVARIN